VDVERPFTARLPIAVYRLVMIGTNDGKFRALPS
jgi:hypothetical protein